MREQLEASETGAETYDIASGEDPSAIMVAERVKDLAREELGREVDIQLVENLGSGETLAEEFAVDTTRAGEQLGWKPAHTVDASVRSCFGRKPMLNRQNSDRISRSDQQVDRLG